MESDDMTIMEAYKKDDMIFAKLKNGATVRIIGHDPASAEELLAKYSSPGRFLVLPVYPSIGEGVPVAPEKERTISAKDAAKQIRGEL